MTDVVIAGGGIVGMATAVHLLTADEGLDVVVVEPDSTYAHAATGKGTGGVRQLFTRPENIRLSQVTLDVVESWPAWAAAAGVAAPELNWRPNGYLFVAGRGDAQALHDNFEVQRAHGVEVVWLTPDEIASRYPQVRVDDLEGAVLSTRDGWLDPLAFFAGIRAKAMALGATVIEDQVTGFDREGCRVHAARLKSGGRLVAEAFVNATGTWAPELVAPLGMRLPVEPMRRHEHYVRTEEDLNALPFIKDARGLAIHSHRQGVSVGLVDFDHPGGDDLTIDPADFRDRLRPALTHRLPGSGDISRQRSWTGLYDQNRLDGNAIIGNWPGRLDNLYIASGFSGHGFMHALGVGRALTELILHGAYRTIDLARLGYQRVIDERPYPELGVR